jgi:molecular chaperone GrpE
MTRNKSKRDPKEAAAAAAPAAAANHADKTQPAPPPAAATPAAPDAGALQRELEAGKEQYLRLLADFDNYRRRVARDRDEMVQRAGEALMTELLPVIDHFELALSQADAPQSPIVVGVRMIYDQMLAVLGKAGLSAIDAVGQTFAHESHEAIACQPSDSVPEGGIIQQTRRGYRLGNRVLRPANVIVSSGPPPPAAPPSAPPSEVAAEATDNTPSPAAVAAEDSDDPGATV